MIKTFFNGQLQSDGEFVEILEYFDRNDRRVQETYPVRLPTIHLVKVHMEELTKPTTKLRKTIRSRRNY